MTGTSDVGRFYEALAQDHLSALWQNLSTLAPRIPQTVALPYLWQADTLRRRVAEAGDVISAEDAERRVVVLENPALAGHSAVTPSLYAGVQLLLSGERARGHRHSAAALRMILSGDTGYTTVDGERIDMKPGDFVVTPSWTFHDHGNVGDGPVTWLDGLDLHIVNFLGAPFGEPDPGLAQQAMTPPRTGRAKMHWPYAEVREALVRLGRQEPPDGVLGHKIAYVDPATGQSPFATMEACMQQLPAGFDGHFHRVTDGTVYCALEGGGEVRLREQTLNFNRHDIFVIPSWTWHRLTSSAGAVLFSFSDRTLQRSLGLWREQRAGLSLPL